MKHNIIWKDVENLQLQIKHIQESHDEVKFSQNNLRLSLPRDVCIERPSPGVFSFILTAATG